jgi:hypothetical protein
MPAKGDRGRSVSDIAGSYSECRRTTPRSLLVRRHASSRLFRSRRSRPDAPTARTGRRCPAEAVPRRGWTSWTLEIAHSLISTDMLEIISNRHAENAKRPGKPPFSDFQGHFHGDGCRSGGWKWRPARRRVDASSDKASSVDSHPVEPTLAASHRPLRRPSRTVSRGWGNAGRV